MVLHVDLVLRVSQPGTLFLSELRFSQDKNQSLGSPLKSQNIGYVLLFSFSPQGDVGSWEFSPNNAYCAGRRGSSECAPWISLPVLDAVGFMLAELQETSNWFLHFLQRQLVCVLLLSWCFCGGSRFWGFLFWHLADDIPHDSSHSFLNSFIGL